MSIVAARADFHLTRSIADVLDIVVQVRVYGGVRRGQQMIEEAARGFAPTLSGELVGSIRSLEPVNTGKEIIGTVVADAPHAGFVEFGTGLRGAGTYPGELPTEGVPITGGWVYDYKNQGWVGMPAHPFMRPAYELARQLILGEF